MNEKTSWAASIVILFSRIFPRSTDVTRIGRRVIPKRAQENSRTSPGWTSNWERSVTSFIVTIGVESARISRQAIEFASVGFFTPGMTILTALIALTMSWFAMS